MDVDNNKYRLNTHSIAIILMALGYNQSAIGVEFNIGEVSGAFNSKLTVGSSWRVAERDMTSDASRADSNLNYDKGDAFTQIFTGQHNLKLQYKNVGLFVRGKYWHDYAMANNAVNHGNAANGFVPNEIINDSNYNDLAKDRGIELLDAYTFADFTVGNIGVDLRLGKQVINWGEGKLIYGGINTINPIDVPALFSPGGNLLDALIPVNMAYANLSLTSSLNFSSFYQFGYQASVLNTCGSYFSNNDFLAEGCDYLLIGPESMSDEDKFADGRFVIERGTDNDVSEDGQFGLSLQYTAAALNDTQLGLYYMNYHSRTPLASAEAGTFNPANPVNNPKYHSSYPEDIQLIGLSFNTRLPWILSGEISHRLDMPLQINGGDLMAAALTPDPDSPLYDRFNGAAQGETVEGFDRFDYTQAQLSAMLMFKNALGANKIILISELGYGHTWDLDESEGAIKYGRATVYKDDKDDGYATSNSAGYRLAARAHYRNLYKGITLTPAVMWAHDVYGYSPSPGSTFMEGRTATRVSATADYLKMYSMAISYTAFNGDYDPRSDRDFVSASVSLSF